MSRNFRTSTTVPRPFSTVPSVEAGAPRESDRQTRNARAWEAGCSLDRQQSGIRVLWGPPPLIHPIRRC
ncbi:hypothetical protein IG631_22444 [Alternaria alternata]|nr:hypothetical protein IG631_22444 [Alternaria alternata]